MIDSVADFLLEYRRRWPENKAVEIPLGRAFVAHRQRFDDAGEQLLLLPETLSARGLSDDETAERLQFLRTARGIQ